MSALNIPPPLRAAGRLALTAVSSGAEPPMWAHLDFIINGLKVLGFDVVEGDTLRTQHKDQSAPATVRAAELKRFLTDPRIDAVLPPWGGERAIELLPLLDFEALRHQPAKWFAGFSDVSTLAMPLCLVSGWASVHCSNMMDWTSRETEPLVRQTIPILASDLAAGFSQHSSTRYQTQWARRTEDPGAPFNMTEPTRWQRLDGRPDALTVNGCLIGGCLDTVRHLAGTPFGDVPRFIRNQGAEGTIVYLENCEGSPCDVARSLMGLKLAGWFDGVSGVLLGRNSAPDAKDAHHLSYHEALRDTLSDLHCPVLIDLDIGHHQPQFTLINGLQATVTFENHSGTIHQIAP